MTSLVVVRVQQKRLFERISVPFATWELLLLFLLPKLLLLTNAHHGQTIKLNNTMTTTDARHPSLSPSNLQTSMFLVKLPMFSLNYSLYLFEK